MKVENFASNKLHFAQKWGGADGPSAGEKPFQGLQRDALI
jgi:hypothetical protein